MDRGDDACDRGSWVTETATHDKCLRALTCTKKKERRRKKGFGPRKKKDHRKLRRGASRVKKGDDQTG